MDTVYFKTFFPVENFKNSLLEEYNNVKNTAELYLYKSDIIQWPSHSNYYIISKDIPVAQSVADKFKELYSIECFPRYYILKEGFVLDIHKDAGTQASFNYLLSEENDPIVYRINGKDIEISYKKGLLNLQELHSVPPTRNERILLKLSIYDYTFETCKQKVMDYENSNIR